MKKLLAVLSVSVLLVGCQSDHKGALVGAGVGAAAGGVLGGVIGHQSGHKWEGAAIGAGVGAATGAVVGHQVDKSNKANSNQPPPQDVPPQQ